MLAGAIALILMLSDASSSAAVCTRLFNAAFVAA